MEYKYKSYCHFDPKKKVNRRIEKYLNSPTCIKNHRFYPFLHIQAKTFKFKNNERKEKIRDLYYSAHLDRYVFQHYANILEKHYEEYLQDNNLFFYPTAYRKLDKKSNIDFAKEAFEYIKGNSNCIVVCADIEKFFDTLNHIHLKKTIKEVLKVKTLSREWFILFKQITKFTYLEREDVLRSLGIKQTDLKLLKRFCEINTFKDVFVKTKLIKQNKVDKGIPQGSSMSAILSNIYMINFDKEISKFVNFKNGFYRRYSDDIIIIIPSPWSEKEIKEELKTKLEKYHLSINIDKTVSSIFNSGRSSDKVVQYLGFDFDGERVKIRKKTITNYYNKLYRRIRIIKTVQHLQKNPKSFFKRFYKNYTHLGKNNFISYVNRASEKFNDSTLKIDIKYHWNKIYRKLSKKSTNL
jgi:hypothetical protein